MTQEEKNLVITYNGLYQEEIDYFYKLPKEKQEELIKATEEQITTLEPNEQALAKEMGSLILAIYYCDDLLEEPITEDNVNSLYKDRIQYIEEARKFFEKPESEVFYLKHRYIPSLYASGHYKKDDDFIDFVYQDEGFSISSIERRRFKETLERVWKNDFQFPSEEILKEESIKQNGIGFKEFLFCEEYIKQGKIVKVAESLGIGRTTCYDYLKKPEVKEYLDQRRQEIKQESDDLLKTGFNDCFSELHQIVTNEHTDRQTKIKAIDTYLKHYEQSLYKQIQE